MAVDIYCYAELQTKDGWVFSGEVGPNPEHAYDSAAPEFAPVPAFHAVHKELAAILVDTGRPIRSTEPYEPIVSRRGQPEDLSPVLKDYFKYFAADDAMVYSWFTMEELVDFNLQSRTMIRQAYVEAEVAHLFADCPSGFPFSRWPKDKPIRYAGQSRDGVEVRWRESYASIIGEFSGMFPNTLLKLGGARETRLVVQAGW